MIALPNQAVIVGQEIRRSVSLIQKSIQFSHLPSSRVEKIVCPNVKDRKVFQ